MANRLVAMSSAAVLAVYTAGYTRTRSAANRLDAQAAQRRFAMRPPAPAAVPPEVAAEKLLPASSAGREPLPNVAAVKPGLPLGSKAAASVSKAAPELETAANPPAVPAAPVAEPKEEASTPQIYPVEPAPAPPAAAAPLPPPVPPAPAWKDGTYLGWGSSRHGDIQASVVVAGGRISSATIAQCLTRYSCSVIEKLPPEVAERQSPDVDYISGATQSANAFYYAVVDALSKAK